MKTDASVRFAPHLYIPGGMTTLLFYQKAFGARELRRFTNPDGTIHVLELEIEGNLFHLHEENRERAQFSPDQAGGTTVAIGLFVGDVDKVIEQALAAGAATESPARDYEYGYRQGMIRDPFGHLWLIEARLSSDRF